MRTFGMALALVAAAQLTLLSTPAFADGTTGYTSSESAPPPASSGGKKTAGWVLLGVGGALTIGGVVIDAIAGSKNQVSGAGGAGDTGTTQHEKTDLLWGGTTMIVAGVLAGIYGGSLLVTSRKADADAQTAAPPPAAGTSDAITRTAQASLATGPSFVMPIVGARF